MKRQARSYSIVDHELLHGGHLRCLSHQSMALYLFLVVVEDEKGRNFYTFSSIRGVLKMNHTEIYNSIGELIKQGLIDYQPPYLRVLTLTYAQGNAHTCKETVSPLVRQILRDMDS